MLGRLFRRRLWISVVALAVVAAGGGAYAATRGGSGQSSSAQRSAFLADVARRLGVSQTKLTSALRAAFFDRLDAAVAAGRLSKAQADAIKQRAQQTGLLPFGPMLGFGRREFRGPVAAAPLGAAPLQAAARYLGLSNARLVQQLSGGRSLADVARSHGRSVSGLKQAMAAAVKARLDLAVSERLISRSQEEQLLKRLSARLDRELNSRAILRFGLHRRPGAFAPGPGAWRGPGPGSAPPLPQGGGQGGGAADGPPAAAPPAFGPPGNGSSAGSASTPY